MTDDIQGASGLEEEGHIDEMDEELSDTKKAAEKLRKYRDELFVCQSERKEYLDGWQRARADFANYKKEQDRLIGDLKTMAEEKMLSEILTLADGFDQAFSHDELLASMPEALRIGFEQLKKELDKLFAKYEVVSYGNPGDNFDPALHSAVASESTDKSENDHTLAIVHKRGYKRRDRVIRAALVAVYTKT